MRGFISIEAIIVLIILIVSSILAYHTVNEISQNPFELHKILFKKSMTASHLALSSGLSTNNTASSFYVIDSQIGSIPLIKQVEFENTVSIKLWVSEFDSYDNLTIHIANGTSFVQCTFSPPYEGYGTDTFLDITSDCSVPFKANSISIRADDLLYLLSMEIV
jgi:hypothetical protein